MNTIFISKSILIVGIIALFLFDRLQLESLDATRRPKEPIPIGSISVDAADSPYADRKLLMLDNSSHVLAQNEEIRVTRSASRDSVYVATSITTLAKHQNSGLADNESHNEQCKRLVDQIMGLQALYYALMKQYDDANSGGVMRNNDQIKTDAKAIKNQANEAQEKIKRISDEFISKNCKQLG